MSAYAPDTGQVLNRLLKAETGVGRINNQKLESPGDTGIFSLLTVEENAFGKDRFVESEQLSMYT